MAFRIADVGGTPQTFCAQRGGRPGRGRSALLPALYALLLVLAVDLVRAEDEESELPVGSIAAAVTMGADSDLIAEDTPRAQFEANFTADVAGAIGVEAARVHIINVASGAVGSTTVDFAVLPDEDGVALTQTALTAAFDSLGLTLQDVTEITLNSSDEAETSPTVLEDEEEPDKTSSARPLSLSLSLIVIPLLAVGAAVQ